MVKVQLNVAVNVLKLSCVNMDTMVKPRHVHMKHRSSTEGSTSKYKITKTLKMY